MRNENFCFIKHIVRLAYQTALKSLEGHTLLNSPSFKTWLYIYRNNSVEEEFKTIIREQYLVDVKDIDRLDFSDFNDNDSTTQKSSTTTTTTTSNDVTTETPIDEINISVIKDPENSKDIPDFETLKKTSPLDPDDDSTRLLDEQKNSSKFDEVVEDRQYVEVPVIREEISKEKLLEMEKEQLIEIEKEKIMAENDGYVKEAEDMMNTIKATKEEIKETVKIKIPLKNVDSLEIMDAQESSTFVGREFASHADGDVAHVISGNSLVGRKLNANDSDAEKTESKLILFNGLYYRGSWAIPFQVKLNSELNFFFYKNK